MPMAFKLAQNSGATPLTPAQAQTLQSPALTIDDIKRALRDENETNIKPQLNDIQTSITLLANRVTQIEEKHTELENSMSFIDGRINTIETSTIPKIQAKHDITTEDLALKLIEEQTHKRKWGLIISGLDGNSNEDELVTRNKVLNFATQKLKVPAPFTPDQHRLAACHRLKQTTNAPIIVLFTDLSEKNAWLNSGKNLAGQANKISISPDLPPATRPLKQDIMKQKKELRDNGKKSTVKYKPTWPFVILKVEGEATPRIPKISKSEIVKNFLQK